MSHLPKQLQYLLKWYSKDVLAGGGTKGHIFRGFAKAFLVYFVPITLLKRKLTVANFRRALALGVFVSGVRTVDSVLRLTQDQKGENKTDPAVSRAESAEVVSLLRQYSLGVAAFISSFVAFTIDGEVSHSLLVVMWTIARAVRVLVSDRFNIPHAPTIVMSLAASRILTAYIWTPKELAPSYYHFLKIHGGKDEKTVLDVLKSSVPNGCEVIHPGQTCSEHFIKFWATEYIRAAKVYLPVFTLSLILSHKRNWMHWLTNILRSSTFLATYCALAWMSPMCLFSNNFRPGLPMGKIYYYLTLWVPGLATLIEREGRRAELATYCFTYAAESILRGIEKKGTPVLYPTLNLFILSTCIGIMVHNHDQQPKEVIRFLFKLSHT